MLFKKISNAFYESEYFKRNVQFIKESSSSERADNILMEQNNFANLGLQLEMLMWRAGKAKYMVRFPINDAFWYLTISSDQFPIQDTSYLLMYTFQNVMTGLIFGLLYLRYPRLSSVVPYNDDDKFGINGCLFVLTIITHFQVK